MRMRSKIMVSLLLLGLITLLIVVWKSVFHKASTNTILDREVAAGQTSVIFASKDIQTVDIAIPQQAKIAYQTQRAILDLDREEAYLLAKIAMAEAEGEDTEGKALVILVVLNRVFADAFPNTIEGVIYEAGQFSPVSNGRFDRVEPNNDCYVALELVMTGWNKSEGALYFESPSNSMWHQENLIYLFKHGKHYFYTDKE